MAELPAHYAGGPEGGPLLGGWGGGGPGGRISLACNVVGAPGFIGPGGGGIRIPGGIMGIPGIMGKPGRGKPGIPGIGIIPGIIPGGGIIPGIMNIAAGGLSIGSGAGLLNGMLLSLQKFS